MPCGWAHRSTPAYRAGAVRCGETPRRDWLGAALGARPWRWRRDRRESWLHARWRFVPPGFRQIAEQRSLRRMLDVSPARYPLLGKIKQRHDVTAGDENPVQ